MERFNGRVAMITGAAAGIGRATAIEMAKNGADLVLLDLNSELLEKVKRETMEYGVNTFVYKCDISDSVSVESVVSDATKRLGKIDILVNNAAIWRTSKPFLQIEKAEWESYININVMGTVYCLQAVLGGMIERGYGRVINVASVAGEFGNRNMTQYSATKGAILSMTKALAKEVAGNGITVNAVSPGTVSPSNIDDIDYSCENSMNYMGRTGTDRENALLICYLASDAAAYISGQSIIIDGCRKML